MVSLWGHLSPPKKDIRFNKDVIFLFKLQKVFTTRLLLFPQKVNIKEVFLTGIDLIHTTK